MLSRQLLGALLLTFAASTAAAEDFFNSDNGHYYRIALPHSATWASANLYAFQQVRDGLHGHLLTITNAAEQQFVKDTFKNGGAYWTGGFQPLGSPEPGGNWQWVTGEPFEYSNWDLNEPNNSITNEFVIELFSPSGVWNDMTPGNVPSFPDFIEREWIVEFTPGYSPSLDGAAFLQWQRSYNRGGRWPADFDADQRVDVDDLTIWKSYFGGGSRSTAMVPEPSAVKLTLFGILGLRALRRATPWR